MWILSREKADMKMARGVKRKYSSSVQSCVTSSSLFHRVGSFLPSITGETVSLIRDLSFACAIYI